MPRSVENATHNQEKLKMATNGVGVAWGGSTGDQDMHNVDISEGRNPEAMHGDVARPVPGQWENLELTKFRRKFLVIDRNAGSTVPCGPSTRIRAASRW